MMFEVSYQAAAEARQTDSRFKHTKYFETADMPGRDAVAERPRREGVDFEKGTITINRYDAETCVAIYRSSQWKPPGGVTH
jgi:hypothetical protein